MCVTVKLNIECTGSAFEDFGPQKEVARILREALNEVLKSSEIFRTGKTHQLRDVNGNVCGCFEVIPATDHSHPDTEECSLEKLKEFFGTHDGMTTEEFKGYLYKCAISKYEEYVARSKQSWEDSLIPNSKQEEGEV